AETVVVANRDEAALADDDRPYHRVRLDPAATELGLGQRPAHPERVLVRPIGRRHESVSVQKGVAGVADFVGVGVVGFAGAGTVGFGVAGPPAEDPSRNSAGG